MRLMRQGGRARALLPGALLALVAACTINPVTGQRELALVSAGDEVAIGTEQYLPSQQMQGGEYLRDPALTRYVQDVGNRLAAVSDRALPYEFVILNNSVPNAWALPGGKIAINRGLLLELDSEAELAAVLGHEIVHAAARHGAQSLQRGILLQGAVAIAATAAGDRDYSDLAVGAASVGAQLINTRHGRQAELESDYYGMQYMSRAGYDPHAAITLQQTFLRLSEGRDSGGWLAGLFASHPPSSERVAANEQTAFQLPAGGTTGREAYQAATANLRRAAPGFEALDQAREALADDDIATARQQAASAADALGADADIEGLYGDIEMAAENPGRALPRYSRAVELNPRFFYYQFGKAEAHRALNQLDSAQSAYEASIALLPTASAYYGLGRIAESRGDIQQALEHYARAGESSGEAGVAARAATVRLDLPANPGRYISLATGFDSNGQLYIDIGNQTEFTIGDIELRVAYVESGQTRLLRRAVDGTLSARQARRLATGLVRLTSGNQYVVTVESAGVIDN
jgi:predicted Zn-dependent protease